MTKIDPATTALVLIDLQTRIVAMETTPLEGTEVVANAVLLRDAFSAAGSPIVHVRALRPDMDEVPPEMEIVPELTPKDGEHLITKYTIGGFYRTGLDELLRGLGVKTMVLAGIATAVKSKKSPGSATPPQTRRRVGSHRRPAAARPGS
jgi:nicotinamidase-related amidase